MSLKCFMDYLNACELLSQARIACYVRWGVSGSEGARRLHNAVKELLWSLPELRRLGV